MSGIEALLAAAGIDPAAGVQLVGGDALAGVAFDPSLPLVVLRRATVAAVPGTEALPGRHARRGPLAVLRALYPVDHRLRALPGAQEVSLTELDDERLAAADWLVPPLAPLDNLGSPHGMAAISARLRAEDGCPWDRRQDHLTLRRYLLEEAYEAVDAIEHGSPADLAEELGDLFLQVILHAQMAAEAGDFDLTDVYRILGAKIVRRHPHVFGDVKVTGVGEVLANWETMKAAERSAAGHADGPFAGVARALPALPASREIQERAAALGWDWPSVEGVWDKVAEEGGELRAAATPEERLHELGDLLFVVVNLARWLELDPEEALRRANHRWIARLSSVEALARERGIDVATLDAAGRNRLWDEVKHR